MPYPTLPYPFIPYPTLPYLTLPYLTLPYATLPYPTLPYTTPTLPYPTPPYPTIPCPTLPFHSLPYPTLPYPTHTPNPISQADLEHDDVFILDTYTSVYSWVGKQANEMERGRAMDTAAKYVEAQAAVDGRSVDSAVLLVKAGAEPLPFTVHFVGWSDAVARVFEDPYEKRKRILQGTLGDMQQAAPARSLKNTGVATSTLTPEHGIGKRQQLLTDLASTMAAELRQALLGSGIQGPSMMAFQCELQRTLSKNEEWFTHDANFEQAVMHVMQVLKV